MSISNFFSSLGIVFSLIHFSISLEAQSRFEHGISIGVIQGDFAYSDIETNTLFSEVSEKNFTPHIGIRSAYKINKKTKVSIGVGFQWHSIQESPSNRIFEGLLLDIPLSLHYQLWNRIGLQAGLQYQRVLNQVYIIDERSIKFTDFVERDFAGGHIGFNYTLGSLVELGFSFHQNFNSLVSYILTDLNGNPVGIVEARHRYFKLSLVFRK